MEVTKEGMIEPGLRNLWRVEGGVRLLVALFEVRHETLLGSVEYGQVDAASVHAKTIQEVAWSSRPVVTGPPNRKPMVEFVGRQSRRRKHVYVQAPLGELVRALRPVPVVVARSEEHLCRLDLTEQISKESDGVGRDTLVFEEVTA